MGCLPINNKKCNESVQNTSLIPTEINRNPRPSKFDLKINAELLVQQSAGDPFDFYKISKRLGQGAFGEVFKVTHQFNHTIRAMKVINKLKLGMGEEEEKSIIKEINILRKLDHPNILKVYEFFNTKEYFYIITELCTGGELYDLLEKNKYFSEKIAKNIFRQLLSAVQFCHSYNVVHRDLKPENILIESEEESKKEIFTIRVIDFGTSEVSKKNDTLNQKIGTPFYIAPEVLGNSYNEKCDLWSCGVILYMLLSGSPPFTGDCDEEIYEKVKEGKYSLSGDGWDEVSPEAKDLIKKLLKLNVRERLSAEEAIKHPWLKRSFKKESNLPSEPFKKAILNMKNFNADQKLQQAALAFLVRNLAEEQELAELRKIFMDLNEKGDGHLTADELKLGMQRVLNSDDAAKEVVKLINMIDVDGNGFIEYEEFVRASINKEKLLTDESLKQAFNIFDKDGSGTITIDEIKLVLSGDAEDVGDDVWNKIFQEIDVNGEGEINFNLFKDMMNKIILKK